MKRVLSILLILATVLSLAACGKKKTEANESLSTSVATTAPTDEPTAESTAATDATNESTVATKTTTAATEASSKATVTPTATPTTNPTWALSSTPTTKPTTAPTSKPTEKATATPTTKPTEKATEPPHTHTWKNATCQAPKTCTGCGATEASVGFHAFENGICTVCKATDILNPKTYLKISTNHNENEYTSQTYIPMSDNQEMISAKSVVFYSDSNNSGKITGILQTAYFHISVGSDDPDRTTATYNGQTYYRVGDGYNPAEVILTDSDILLISTDEGTSVKMILLNNGNLKVTESTDSNYPVDMLLSTN